MQKVSYEPWMLSETPWSKLEDFQPVTSLPYRVLHPSQGDKQKLKRFLLDIFRIRDRIAGSQKMMLQ